jgi:phage terminase large subunit-like protein
MIQFDPAKLDTTRWRYDPTLPDKWHRFCCKYLRHFEAQHAGKPFIPLPWQYDIAKQLFGVFNVSTGLLRYRYAYIEGPKSLGKSPLLASFAVFKMLFGKDPSSLVISCASTYAQARIVHDKGKSFIRNHPGLNDEFIVHQYNIKAPKQSANWGVISGIPKGKSGFAPSMIVVDELHEFEAKDSELFEFLEGNLIKRDNSQMIIATNSAFDENGICGQWHKRCKNILDGISDESNVLPAVFGAPNDADISDPDVWKAANPSIGTTITLDTYADEYKKVKANPSKEPFFRRLFLGQWVKSIKTWLDPRDLAACIVDEFPDLSALPCYFGFDLGPVDDITALAKLYVDQANDKIYVDTVQWLPHDAAARYEDTHRIPYFQWRERGWINIIPGKTIDTKTQEEIAVKIIALAGEAQTIQFCYDKYGCELIAARLEEAGIICEPISSGFSGIGPATAAFERRVKEHSIHWKRDDCLLWQLSNACAEADKDGKIRPIRFGARGSYIGQDSMKIDAVMAIMYALSRGHLAGLQADKPDDVTNWDGKIITL